MIQLTLSKTEIAICRYIGTMRYEITSKYGTDAQQDSSQKGIEMSIDGVISEYAVSKYMNLHFDLNCDYRKFGADLVSQKGSKIDVKCTKRHGGNLNAVAWSTNKPADIFILTEINGCDVNIIGWIDRATLIHPDNIANVGNGEFYSLPQSRLIPFNEQAFSKTR